MACLEYRGIQVLGHTDHLETFLASNTLDEIEVTLSLEEYSHLEQIVAACEKSGVHTKFIPDYKARELRIVLRNSLISKTACMQDSHAQIVRILWQHFCFLFSAQSQHHKGLGLSQNRRVSGQRLCLLILQIPVFSGPKPMSRPP